MGRNDLHAKDILSGRGLSYLAHGSKNNFLENSMGRWRLTTKGDPKASETIDTLRHICVEETSKMSSSLYMVSF